MPLWSGRAWWYAATQQSFTATAGTASVTVTGYQPSFALSGDPANAVVAVAALSGAVSINPVAGIGQIIVAGETPISVVSGMPTLANITVTGLPPIAAVGGVPSGASVTLTANNSIPSLDISSEIAHVNVTTGQSSPSIGIVASIAQVVVAAFNGTGHFSTARFIQMVAGAPSGTWNAVTLATSWIAGSAKSYWSSNGPDEGG